MSGPLLLAFLALAPPAGEDPARELGPPVRIEAAGRPIDTEVGHAAPFVADFDGDGVRDLLVGQFHEGRLRVYRNAGSNSRPRFDSYTWFRAGGKVASVPVG